jgi:hypothetical protein
MPSLRVRFPEKEEPTTIVLSGDRITVGRLPNNTIQIIDRVISATHAELVREPDGHYRLHDRGSMNGTFVNGQAVSDFHLREACKVSFGTLEAEFTPEGAEAAAGETLPTRAEFAALQQTNAELAIQRDALREEIEALRQARPAAEGEAELVVAKTEFEKVTAEREALKEADHRRLSEIEKLKTQLAVLQRDRENLQRALDSVKAAPAASVDSPKAAPVEESSAPIAARPLPSPAGSPPRRNPAPTMPLQPGPPPSTPTSSSSNPGEIAAGSPTDPATGTLNVPPATPTLKAVPNPVMAGKPFARPLPQAPLAAPRAAGPAGTQKISGDSAGGTSGGLKPVSKLNLRPLARPAGAPKPEQSPDG